MNNVFCSSCKQMVAPGPYCNNCGASFHQSATQPQSGIPPQPQQVSHPPNWQQPYPPGLQQRTKKPMPVGYKILGIGCLGLFVLFVVLGIIGAISDKRKQAPEGSAPVASTPSNATPGATTAPSPSSSASDTQQQAKESAEHLAQAKSMFRTGLSKDELATIKTHLEAIPPKAAEYKEAQSLSAKVETEIKQRDREDEARAKQAEIDANPLEVVSAKWEKDGFGTVAVWRVTFNNRSDKPVGNIKYRTAYFAETGAKVDAGGVDALLGKGLIQKVIPPHQKRTLEINDGFVNNEAHTGKFEVVAWEFIK